MNVTAVYEPAAGLVRLTATELTAAGPGTIRIERSTSAAPAWIPVRGATAIPVPETGEVTVDDYEYTPAEANRYRIAAAVWIDQTQPSTDQTWGNPWQVPAGVHEVEVACTGAGAGPVDDGDSAAAGAGGGAHAASRLPVTPGDVLGLVTGRSAGPGEHGAASAVIAAGELVVAADGGKAGASPAELGAGGSAVYPQSIGEQVFPGGPGGARESATGAGGGGGGAASPAGPGGPGGPGTAGTGGAAGTTGWPIAAAATTSVGTTPQSPHTAPSLTATGPGLLVATWTTWEHTEPHTIPASMNPLVAQTGTWSAHTIATEPVTGPGATGVREADVPAPDRYSAASLLVHGPAVSIAGYATDLGSAAPAQVTLDGVPAGAWLVAICSQDADDDGALSAPPTGGPWLAAAGTGATPDRPRTMIWCRRVQTAGPVTVTQALGAAADTHLTVMALTGTDTAATAVSGGPGGDAGADGGPAAAPGGGGGGRGAGGATAISGPGGHGRVTVRTWGIEATAAAEVTPAPAGAWLKWAAFPFLNRQVRIAAVSDRQYQARKGVMEISGRSAPVIVADVHQSATLTYTIRTATAAEADDLVTALRHGGTVLIETPAGSPLPAGWVEPFDITVRPRGPADASGLIDLACRVAAPPGPEIAPANPTWATIARTWGTWEAIGAATWADLGQAAAGVPGDLVQP